MIVKQADRAGRRVWVTFRLPASIWAERVCLVGDFNNWDPGSLPFTRDEATEDWTLTLALEPNRRYCFRYLVDGEQWITDFQADQWCIGADGLPCSTLVTGSEVPAWDRGRSLVA